MRNTIRQPTVSTSRPPTSGPSKPSADVADAQMPNARPRSTPASKVWVMIDSAPGTRNAPAAPWSSRKRTSHSSVGANPHSADVAAKLASPIA
jgi:hypothetical protein